MKDLRWFIYLTLNTVSAIPSENLFLHLFAIGIVTW